MQFKRRREMRKARIEIIPMVDTMFFLLVFFMLSSLALTRLNGLPVNLPLAATAPKQPPVDLTVTIDPGQNVYVNKDRVGIADLGPALVRAAHGADLTSTAVVVNADLSVPHGIVVRCLDEARSVGISRFSIATKVSDGASVTP